MRRTFTVGLGLLLSASTAFAAPSADGVFFVHGTGDYSAAATTDSPCTVNTRNIGTSSTCQTNPTTGSAISGYWTQSSINTMIRDPAGGNWTYGVAGYGGASYSAATNSGVYQVASQIEDFYRQTAAITNIVLVTHSNGSNVIRYMAAHPTYTNSRGTAYSTILSWVKRVVFVAPDSKGTPLADKVTSSGTMASIANEIYTFFGGSSWNNPAVNQQTTTNMNTYNGNGTFATVANSYYVFGTGVYANIFSSDAWCGGYATTVGLKACALYGWGSFSAATDGFIGTDSSDNAYSGTRAMNGDSRLNHNQSRRSCHGSGATIAATAHGALSGTFDAIPTDYTISPAAQACNATWQGWYPGSGSSWFYAPGCTSSMQTDGNNDFDCQTAYGGDDGYNLSAVEYPSTLSAYFNGSYYSNPSVGCSDTWLGDGECDLCLWAKYGYDSATGNINDDDCVNQGAGTQNRCADIKWYNPYAENFSSGGYGYYSYIANH